MGTDVEIDLEYDVKGDVIIQSPCSWKVSYSWSEWGWSFGNEYTKRNGYYENRDSGPAKDQ